jgi:KaiC/GvpD/RAD55 family RecA-like ATPase
MGEYQATLGFNKKFQAGLLVLMIRDFDFLRLIEGEISTKYLDAGDAYLKLLKLIKAQYGVSKKPLTIDIIRNVLVKLEKIGTYSQPEVYGINSVIDLGLTLTHSEFEYVKDHAFDFFKKQVVARAVSESIGYLENNDYDSIFDAVTKAYKKSFSVGESLGINYLTSPVIDRYSEPPRMGIWSSGYGKLDNFIEGGFATKECYTVLSPTGRGKTALLCNFGVAALRANKKVLFITLEMSDKQICHRFDSIISGFSASEIANSGEVQTGLVNSLGKYKAAPYVKGFNRGSLTLSGLRTYLDRFNNEVWKPDVVILDWLGCLKFKTTYEKRHEQMAEAADELVNISREYDITLITAHQTNRSAVSHDVFDYSSVSESFASLFGLDLVMSLGASNESKDAGKRTLGLLKNRCGPDSVSVKLVGDLPGHSLTFRFREAVDDDDEEATLLSPPTAPFIKK